MRHRTPTASPPLHVLLMLLALTLLAASVPACSDDGGGSAGDSSKPPTAFGSFTVSVGGRQVTVDYTGGRAEVAMIHRLNDAGGPACVSRVVMKLSRPDESCLLELTFVPSAAGGLSLAQGQFHAVHGVTLVPCDDWPGAKPGKPLVYKLKSGKNTFLGLKPIAPPEAAKTDATVAGLELKPAGEARFVAGGKQILIKFGTFGAKGDIASKGSKTASCGTATGPDQCADPGSVSLGNGVGQYLRRPLTLYSCEDGSAYDVAEHCGSDALWLTTYRRWTQTPCGGCAAGTICVRNYTSKSSYQAKCYPESTQCGGCKDGDKSVCALGGDGKDACFEPVHAGDDMALREVLDGYKALYDKVSADLDVAAIFVVAEGAERARGTCKESGDGKRTCDGDGPAANQQDCAAVKARFGIPDDVVMLYDKDKKYWASNEWIGPEYYANGMLVMRGDTKIVAIFPDPSSGGSAPGVAQVQAAIQQASEGL